MPLKIPLLPLEPSAFNLSESDRLVKIEFLSTRGSFQASVTNTTTFKPICFSSTDTKINMASSEVYSLVVHNNFFLHSQCVISLRNNHPQPLTTNHDSSMDVLKEPGQPVQLDPSQKIQLTHMTTITRPKRV